MRKFILFAILALPIAAFGQLAAPTIKVTSSNDASAVPPNYYTSVAVIFNNYVLGAGFICWTTNGVTPTATVPGTCDAGTNTYDASVFTNITLATSGLTIQAIATQAGQVNSSVTSSGTVTIIGPPVVFSLGTGRYIGAQSVALSVLPGAQVPAVTYHICYTTDGSTPTTTTPGGTCGGSNTATQTYSSPISVTAAAPGVMISALVSVSGLANGAVASNIYTILPSGTAQTTWYVRPDGGSRFSTGQPTGQCNGMFDASYASTGGTGTNQNCAFNDVRYLWQDRSYTTGYFNGTAAYPTWGWIIAGGDTAIIRGSIGTGVSYRVGYNNDGTITYDGFGIAGDPGASGAPPPPSGTASQPTQILGENYGACTSPTAKTQLHGGYGAGSVLALQGSSNVNLKCLDITDFTQCSIVGGNGGGAFQWPSGCSKSAPYDDYAENGITTDQASANILMQDLNIHGLTLDGLGGPIGGLITMTRVNANFNGATAWNFDNGGDQPNSINSSIVANYVNMIGNGCNEEYPIVHTSFPAISCYNIDSAGFGDSWSGQDTPMANFTCDHCQMLYNTKDGFIGPHVAITTLTIANSASYGNLGQQWKWGSSASGATQIFENNITGGNCSRFLPTAGAIPGMNTNVTYFPNTPTSGTTYIDLPSVCRAAGDMFAFPVTPGSNYLFANNTVYGYTPTFFDINNLCGSCSTTPIIFRNNVFLGYTTNGSASLPGLFYAGSAPITSDHNIESGLRNGDCPVTGTSTLCVSPQLVNQPTGTGSTFVESELDNFNPAPTTTSPVIGAGVAISGLTTDYNGVAYSNPPVMGAVNAASSSPTLVSIAVTPNPGSVAVGSTLTITCTSTFSDSSTAACTSPTWTSSVTADGTVNSSGVVTGVAAGTTTITAAIGGISGSAPVTVSASAPTLVSISVTPNPGSVNVGSTLAMTCTATFSNSSTSSCSSPTWTSATPSVATVSAGTVTGVSAGSSSVSAAIGSISGAATVNVSTPSTVMNCTVIGNVTVVGSVMICK